MGNLIFVEQAIERHARNPERSRRARQISRASVDGLADGLALGPFTRLGQGLLDRNVAVGPDMFETEVFGPDELALAHHHRAPDPIYEFAHVAGPMDVMVGF